MLAENVSFLNVRFAPQTSSLCSAIPSAFFSLHAFLYSVMFLPQKHQVCAVHAKPSVPLNVFVKVLPRTFRACALFPRLGVIITRLFSWFALFSNMFLLFCFLVRESMFL